MKTPLIVFILLFASFAVAQNQSAKEDPGLRFAQMAFNASNAVEHQSLEGYVAVFVDDKSWTALSKDSDLGPFLKLKEQKAERRLVFFYSGPDAQRVVVYCDGPAATDVAVFTPGPNAKVTADLLKPVPEKLKANAATDGWTFTPENVNSDNGEEVPGYRITKAESKK